MFQNIINTDSIVNEMIVPITPNKVIYPKFFTKLVFFKLYPAAKIMGGRMNTKNVDSLN